MVCFRIHKKYYWFVTTPTFCYPKFISVFDIIITFRVQKKRVQELQYTSYVLLKHRWQNTSFNDISNILLMKRLTPNYEELYCTFTQSNRRAPTTLSPTVGVASRRSHLDKHYEQNVATRNKHNYIVLQSRNRGVPSFERTAHCEKCTSSASRAVLFLD